MAGACSTYGGKGEVCTVFWWGNLGGRRPLGRTRFIWVIDVKLQDGEHGMELLALNMYRFRAVVNAVMKLGFHKMRGI